MLPTARIARILPFTLLLLATAAYHDISRASNSLGRDEDPVVIRGTDLPSLSGEHPESIVAFRYQGGWYQIPVQVDERDVVDFGVPYDTTNFGLTAIMFTDDGTFTGPDSDPAFDGDDELVFMAKDAGDARAPFAGPDPPGVVPGTRQEIRVTNLDPTKIRLI